ncbi:exodeoxyribonuclease VII small subunit [Anaerofustis stercorihominis]|uniref:Exodeoxyribonuclease 7 small subunit n=2 Tax=Anaerofustis stercorihominis TaxID=214853 RepID=B1C648_9FIRM|nr:exodeoxyribonuclease VII small subunit [Anaerofustis stercorihominis]EDS73333.1 exodeoxyribonuclease VII, small subunit [Anaerofustis stercorihominis DSM 17244]MCQ4794784.1 exodeoxyribonuclease VII small subunit [Anaerofustis stercorihominis]MCR2033076.1 exodeoxyribonuclease VII small subunit [Anaerofustis stercorihominis]RGD75631.1 exodeoxyribonuclease VII small subunit [Anaerofustis stercorihominis]
MGDKKTFEEKLQRLEEISTLMEESKITLDKSVKLYDEADVLIKELKEELTKASEKVKVLVDKKDDEPIVEDFEEE